MLGLVVLKTTHFINTIFVLNKYTVFVLTFSLEIKFDRSVGEGKGLKQNPAREDFFKEVLNLSQGVEVYFKHFFTGGTILAIDN